ncbi:MAG: hypothetical protein K0B11_14005 [Mariniphaga sp.]|nr:hypothetical protein [Mariniphaga sp.]
MKTLLKIFFFAALTGLLAGCNKTDAFIDDETVELKKAQVEVTVPFIADLVGDYVGFFFPGDVGFECDEIFNCRVLIDAQGTATHMGKIESHFNFCACGPDDPEIEGPDSKYGPTDLCFTAANGDKLFLSCGGSVVDGRLPHHPEDVNSYWHDPFVITGGTGKFEGATGSGWTDDYNRDSYPANSFHHWSGEITLVKGKK